MLYSNNTSITREIHKCSYGALLVFRFLISIYRILDGSYMPSRGIFNYWYIQTITNIQFLRENSFQEILTSGKIVFLLEKQLSSSQESNIGMRFNLHVAFSLFIVSGHSGTSSWIFFLNPKSSYFNTYHLPDTLYNGILYIQHTWDWSHSRPF